jgi:RNA polymerase sigma-70 factor (ECF subfamily)
MNTAIARQPSFADTDRLYQDFGATVTRWARRLTRSPADADDVVQEVFLVFHRRRPEVGPLANPGLWLFRVTQNVARHLWRERRRGSLDLDEVAELADARPDPFEVLERRTALSRLDQAMGTLCRRDRRLIYLCDVQRLPTSRVTALTGMKAQTLRVRRYRARRRLARWLDEADHQLPQVVRSPTCRTMKQI